MDTFFLFVSQNFIAFLFLVLCLTILVVYEGKKGGKKIDPSEATRLINKESALIVDLRSLEEFSSGHVAGSLNITPDKVEQRLSALNHSKDKPLILICKTGSNSKGVGASLLKAGYLDVNVISGGMMTWQASGMPLSK